MKAYLVLLAAVLSSPLFSQTSSVDSNEIIWIDGAVTKTLEGEQEIDHNGFSFEQYRTSINSDFSDFGAGFFRGKFIFYSAKKIGLFSKKDPNTGEPYLKLYCADVESGGNLARPLLFSSVLNKFDNLGAVAFTNNENEVYFTQSSEENTGVFKLYKAELSLDRPGEWINIQLLPFNMEGYSIESPYLVPDGKTLYFASNLPGSNGGFDIFSVTINEDGSYGNAIPLEGSVNTAEDEKCPYLTQDGEYLYFSSTGHENFGGYDVLRARKIQNGFGKSINLGSTINTRYNELSYMVSPDNIGYLTSNRPGGKGGYDIYKVLTKNGFSEKLLTDR